jgi:segregation and condensation protein A
VRLDAFEGPLDLLLFLIRKDEIDVHDIPVARVADQYLSFLHELKSIDIDAAGEFLVMAATLMEVKARMLAPAPPVVEGQTEARPQAASTDPRADLVRQLLEYKQYRDAASALEGRFEDWRARFPATAAAPPGAKPKAPVSDEILPETDLDNALASTGDLQLEDLDLVDLVEAFRKIVETVDFRRVGDHQVTYDDTPIELHAEDLLDRLRREPDQGLTLQAVFVGRRRNEMIGLFLAMLELVRRRAINIRQESLRGEIFVRVADAEANATPADGTPPEATQA